MPYPPLRPEIPILSDLINPIFRIETTYVVCNCREIEETQVADEKWASVNLLLPRIDLQQSLNAYANEEQVSNCHFCNQIRRESVQRRLVYAPQIKESSQTLDKDFKILQMCLLKLKCQ